MKLLIILSIISLTINPAYNRKDWPHWIDEDRDCQNTRAEILIRDNVGTIKFKRNKQCNVSWGKWVCPYTGNVYTKASDIDIDHIVPLSYAHRHGAAGWSRERKRAFANDPLNLLAVEDNTNQAKGSKGPTAWMPPRTGYHAEYCRMWSAVITKYGLEK
jgi:5-methylcytosine-specific restriction endonuclease McrA